MLRTIAALALVFVLGSMLSADANPTSPTRTTETDTALAWRGCGISKKAFMSRCAEIYERETGVRIRLSGGGAALGIQAAGEGGADFGGTCRHCIDRPEERDLDVALTLTAWDALVVIAHPSNPVKGLSVEQLRGILQGQTTNWSEVGGPDLPIVLVARKGKTSGVGFMVRLLVLDDTEFEFGPKALRLASSGPVEKLVERSPGAIAITGISSARLRKVKILELDGYRPSKESIRKGQYPYFRPLYLAHRTNLTEAQQSFRDWILGPHGQRIVSQAGTVNLEEGLFLVDRFPYFAGMKNITNLDELRERARSHGDGSETEHR